MKFTLGSFILGIIVGAVGTLLLFGMRSFFINYTNWGKAQVYFDEQARAEIDKQGFTLPSTATDPYYFIDGFSEHRIFLAFSGPRKVLDRIVIDKTGKQISELVPWKQQISHDDFMYSPGIDNPKYQTMFYEPSRVKRGYFYQADKGYGESWHLIYDRDGERVYYFEG